MIATTTATIQQLDPELIDVSRYSGRHESVFRTDRFRSLKDSILHSGGNAVPVLASPTIDGRFALGYGVLRRQACHELGLPVLAMVERIGDQRLFVTTVAENHAEGSISPFERGVAYMRALDAGLLPSPRRLADAANVTVTDVHACSQLARLPQDAVAAFPRVTDIKAAWSKKLADAQERDPQLFLERARALRHRADRPTAAAVYAELARGYKS